jgi:hypothetical protein
MKKKSGILFVLAAMLTVYASTMLAGDDAIPLKPAAQAGSLSERFGKYYSSVAFKVNPSVPPYALPLAPGSIQNLASADQFLTQKGAREMLLKNGMVTVNWGANEDMVVAYKQIKDTKIPVFITTDSLLHLYHIQFDETLRRMEEKQFYPDMIKISATMQKEMLDRYNSSSGATQKAYLKGAAFFSVGLKLLSPDAKVPGEVKKYVDWEVDKIEAHQGFPSDAEAASNSIFTYMEDYSQYVPRGHYTQSENLKRYFKAMMWYGRMTMLIKGDKEFGLFAPNALVPPEEAKTQTILAAAIAGLAGNLKVDNAPLLDKWNRIYMVSAYYIGFSDDLSIYEYADALRSVFGNSFKPLQLANDSDYLKFQAQLASLHKPVIYSGAGQSGVNLDQEKDRKMTPEQLARTLGKTQGFRFMGQRYVPDSFILGQMVAPTVGGLSGTKGFTTACIPDVGCIRVFPRGLDVMAVLGSKRAAKIMAGNGDSQYVKYPETFDLLKKQFDAVSEKDWNQNLYWSWLYALKSLASEPGGKGWPTFTQTDAWKDKQLNAALASWSGLRHDTILYVKQSYTMTVTAEAAAPPPPPQQPVVGYVEPAPEFYARLVALTKMNECGLKDLGTLDSESENRLGSLDQVLTRLLDLSTKELANQKLTEDDYNFIRDFAENISSIVSGASSATQKTTIIADVHTDQNTKSVLEEGTGYLRLMLVAYKMPQGHILVGAGPVYSYYEFKQPMSDRLTDEKWRDLLKSSKPPELPEWNKSFASF